MHSVQKGLVAVFFLGGVLPAGAADLAIRLKARQLRTDTETIRESQVSVRRLAADRSHYLIQFASPPRPEEIAELKNRGARITSYVPDNAVMVAAPDRLSLDGIPVRWHGRLRLEDKLSPELFASESREPEPVEQVFVVELHPDVGTDDGRSLMREVEMREVHHPDLLPNQLLVRGSKEQVARLAGWDEVAYVFPASEDLVYGRPVQPCAGALTDQGGVSQYAKVNQGWSKDGLDYAEVAYVIGKITSRIPAESARAEIERAFAEWSKYAKLRLSAGSDSGAPRTIALLFASGNHGDWYPFDGLGNVLAHTFYPAPRNPESIAGDMHLDDDETWNVGSKVDLFTVVLHEAGHALGLGHSDKPEAVMYPYYRFAAGLTDDDITSIRELYGGTDEVQSASTPKPVVPPLSLNIISPAIQVLSTTQAFISLSGTATGGSGTIEVRWTSDQGFSGIASGASSWTVASVPLSVGANGLTVTASDSNGAVMSKSLTVTRQVDSPPPTIRITIPTVAGNYKTAAEHLTLGGSTTGSRKIVSISWVNSRGGGGTASGTESWVAGPIMLYKGSNLVEVRVLDETGKSASASLTVESATSAFPTLPTLPAFPAAPSSPGTPSSPTLPSGWGPDPGPSQPSLPPTTPVIPGAPSSPASPAGGAPPSGPSLPGFSPPAPTTPGAPSSPVSPAGGAPPSGPSLPGFSPPAPATPGTPSFPMAPAGLTGSSTSRALPSPRTPNRSPSGVTAGLPSLH